jgi:hypothetical protein
MTHENYYEIKISVFIYKVLLEHTHLSQYCVYGFFQTMAELSSTGKDHMTQKTQIFAIWSLTGNIANS